MKVLGKLEDEQSIFDIAWWTISLLRVRTQAEFLVPVVADHSWSVIAGIQQNSCRARLVEDIPQAKRLGASTAVEEADLEWVGYNLFKFAQLLEIPSFRLAVESLTTHQHQTSDRMMIAMLWSGIEGLFNIHSELSFRLAIYISVVIEPAGPNRKAAYQELKKLYGTRSKAVHGAKLSSQQTEKHILDVRAILSRLICKFIEEGEVFSEERIESEIFGVAIS